jgi:hypothetical protein
LEEIDKYEWVALDNYPSYYICREGLVKSCKGKEPIILKNIVRNKDGYLSVCLYNNKNELKQLHRLLAETFIPNPDNLPVVRHLNDNPTDNRLENLAWGTYKDNAKDSMKNGTFHFKSLDEMRSMQLKSQEAIRKTTVFEKDGVKHEFVSLQEGCRQLGLQPGHAWSVARGRRNHTKGYKVYYKEQDKMDIINSFPGYEFVCGEDGKMHNMYMGTDLGFGGYIKGKPGIYRNVALIDATGLHPSSIIAMNKLGEYTANYKALKDARVFIKHRDYESVRHMFDGKLAKYLDDDEEADALSAALKLPINSFYGLSSAGFPNPARDSRDKNNITALRGALFMRTLEEAVINEGYDVIAVRTDSLKIPNADDYIIKFVQDFGLKYAYEMEHECTYDRICLVNESAYIAKYDGYGVRNKRGKHANEWTAVAKQFQVPYVFKSLFSKEPIMFEDMCETKSVSGGGVIYLDMNEDLEADNHDYCFVGKVGLFCPVKPGCGGGQLLRYADGKYSALPGTKGYRWLDAEYVKANHLEDNIDISYYGRLCDDAVATIEKYGSFEEFVA